MASPTTTKRGAYRERKRRAMHSHTGQRPRLGFLLCSASTIWLLLNSLDGSRAQLQPQDQVETQAPVVMYSKQPLTDATLREAVQWWLQGSVTQIIAENLYGPIEEWDTHWVTDFSRLFRWQDTFNDDISKWDVSNGKNFQLMFYGASSFSHDLSSWDMSTATSLSGMFVHASSYNHSLCWASLPSQAFVDDMFCGTQNAQLDPCCSEETLVSASCCGNNQDCTALCQIPEENSILTPIDDPATDGDDVLVLGNDYGNDNNNNNNDATDHFWGTGTGSNSESDNSSDSASFTDTPTHLPELQSQDDSSLKEETPRPTPAPTRAPTQLPQSYSQDDSGLQEDPSYTIQPNVVSETYPPLQEQPNNDNFSDMSDSSTGNSDNQDNQHSSTSVPSNNAGGTSNGNGDASNGSENVSNDNADDTNNINDTSNNDEDGVTDTQNDNSPTSQPEDNNHQQMQMMYSNDDQPGHKPGMETNAADNSTDGESESTNGDVGTAALNATGSVDSQNINNLHYQESGNGNQTDQDSGNNHGINDGHNSTPISVDGEIEAEYPQETSGEAEAEQPNELVGHDQIYGLHNVSLEANHSLSSNTSHSSNLIGRQEPDENDDIDFTIPIVSLQNDYENKGSGPTSSTNSRRVGAIVGGCIGGLMACMICLGLAAVYQRRKTGGDVNGSFSQVLDDYDKNNKNNNDIDKDTLLWEEDIENGSQSFDRDNSFASDFDKQFDPNDKFVPNFHADENIIAIQHIQPTRVGGNEEVELSFDDNYYQDFPDPPVHPEDSYDSGYDMSQLTESPERPMVFEETPPMISSIRPAPHTAPKSRPLKSCLKKKSKPCEPPTPYIEAEYVEQY